MQWPKSEYKGLLGFAIRRRDPDRSLSWLKTALRFVGEKVTRGRLYDSDVAPIQSMVWSDFGLSDDTGEVGLPSGSRFTYEIFAVRGTTEAPEIDNSQSVRISINTEPEHDHGPNEPEVHFNRGLSDMQEYEQLFGEGHQPDDDPAAMAWLARDLEKEIVAFIQEVIDDPSLKLDVAAYHLDSPAVLEALEKVGKRLCISLDWGPEEREDKPGPNMPAYKALKKAGASVHQREHVSISHNKYMVIKSEDGTGKAVLTGSTNFTTGGISTQSNQSVIFRNPDLAAAYLKDFERVLKDDNEGLRKDDAKGTKVGDALEVYFSPHSSKDRPDLERMAELAKGAKSSRLFMTFRMTDSDLISAMLEDNLPVFGVADRAYHGGDDSGDRLIFKEAHSAAPRIAACNAPLDDEPDEGALLRELKREGYNPIVHHKILLLDWDTPDCVVVTGSANYSTNSTQHNDENSVIIHGNQRLAEEYMVEFCRLFTHWYPRWLRERDAHVEKGQEHLLGDKHWTDRWASGGRLAEFHDLLMSSKAEATQPLATPAVKKSLAGERIKNIVVLMMENRSFDQMLGQLPHVDGVTLDKSGKSREHVNYLDPQKPTKATAFPVMQAQFFGIPEGDIPPPSLEDGKVSGLYGGPSHSFPAATQQVYNDSWGPTGSGAEGATPDRMNGFVKAYDASLRRTYQDWAKKAPKFKPPKSPPRDHVEVAMACFSPDQLPVINGLAEAFCVCDKWFSEVPGPTE
ncbi:MAG: phospholipase D-like domain-containing protein, partial [Paracoccaceae bacterium]|nr:phospholipase D-like domain-containing protein [Paracoccaceae bacterium]